MLHTASILPSRTSNLHRCNPSSLEFRLILFARSLNQYSKAALAGIAKVDEMMRLGQTGGDEEDEDEEDDDEDEDEDEMEGDL
jgi:hypothetical protein